MNRWIKYSAVIVGGTVLGAAYFSPAETFLSFVIGWLFIIPAVAIACLVYGLRKYMIDRKNRIVVSIVPSEAMKALARKEAELEREKEILYEELRKGINRE